MRTIPTSNEPLPSNFIENTLSALTFHRIHNLQLDIVKYQEQIAELSNKRAELHDYLRFIKSDLYRTQERLTACNRTVNELKTHEIPDLNRKLKQREEEIANLREERRQREYEATHQHILTSEEAQALKISTLEQSDKELRDARVEETEMQSEKSLDVVCFR